MTELATTSRSGILPDRHTHRTPLRVHDPRMSPESKLRSRWPLLVALRPHQWSKNVLLFAPLFLSHQVFSWSKWLSLAAAFFGFCTCASAVYLLNDLVDLDADRRHPSKRNRPLAAGEISPSLAIGALLTLLVLSFASSCYCLTWKSTAMLAAYVVITTAYSLYLKRLLFLDVLVLAALYTHRLLAGGIAASVEVSDWLGAFAMFFFLSLAVLKRYIELRSTAADEQGVTNRRAYLADDSELLRIIGVAAGYLSVLVLCLYLSSPRAEQLYPHVKILWLIAPVLLYWITRMWFFAHRAQLADDPVSAALTDRASYVVGLVCAGLLVGAAW